MTRTIFFLCFLRTVTFAQEYPTYTMKPLAAKIIDTTAEMKSILVLFQVTTKEEKDFPPVLSMRLNVEMYSATGHGPPQTIILGKKGSNAGITIYGTDLKEKDKYVYELIKDKVDTTYNRDYWVLGFILRKITPNIIDKLDFTYGLWEKSNTEMRLEKKYEFDVQH